MQGKSSRDFKVSQFYFGTDKVGLELGPTNVADWAMAKEMHLQIDGDVQHPKSVTLAFRIVGEPLT